MTTDVRLSPLFLGKDRAMSQKEDINLVTSAISCVFVFCMLGIMIGTAVEVKNGPGMLASLVVTSIGFGAFRSVFNGIRIRSQVILITASLLSLLCGILMQVR